MNISIVSDISFFLQKDLEKRPFFFLFIVVLILSSPLLSLSQSYSIGNSSVEFYDSSRSRSIDSDIYYPADVDGEDVSLTAGTFPVTILGHGFVMGGGSYGNFVSELVPEGYILVVPNTEGGLTPDHQAFGEDLRFLADAMQAENNNPSSLFLGGINNKTAIMGHSMGGGATFLASESNTTISTLVTFAPAETTPSAISAAANVLVPSLIISGNEDCVAPPATHQNPMYDALGAECKTHISILGGGHCYFADYNFNCTFGESTCLPIVPISREEQQDVVFDFLHLWLSHHLLSSPNSLSAFNDSLNESSRINFNQNCTTTSLDDTQLGQLTVFPNPSTHHLNVQLPFSSDFTGELLSPDGRVALLFQESGSEIRVGIGALPKGIYLLRLRCSKGQFSQKVVII